MPDTLSPIPEVTDEDIEWVSGLMRLEGIDASRRAFLTSRLTLDVSACPGSGKTTLIVAKLAILARKWSHRTKGICVLSHTNSARQEIERGLGRTVVGQRLLGYPHFIDTIHGFVNRFLALPWLNSNGYPSPTIDNDVTSAYRRGVLSNKQYWTVQNYLIQKHTDFDSLRICGRDLRFDIGGKQFPAGSGTDSFKFSKRAIEASARAGYFCYDELFVWARALLEDFPDVPSCLKRRFPLVIIDEMQDTFNHQGVMLHAVFPRNSPDVVVQRVGDPNQAIFDSDNSRPNLNDPFPDPHADRCLGIPNSYRFGPEIAALASPFAVIPLGANGLCGVGPKVNCAMPAKCPHTIFVFPDENTNGLLDAYGKHVLTVFDNSVLAQGIVTAVGAVHQDAPEVPPGDPQFPKTVPHYWSGYTAELSRKDPHPKSLVQYVRAAQAAGRDSRELSPGIEKIASGLIRLAGRIGDVARLKRKARTHRAVLEALTVDHVRLLVYRRLIKALVIDWMPLTKENWGAMREDILTIACALCEGATDTANANDFLAWSAKDASLACRPAGSPNDPGPNIYRVTEGERHVDIRLGSIHSVKGQTHLATMVLNTFWHAHSSRRMLPWLLGTQTNGIGTGSQDRIRLLQTYVAMTRPTHLICLAIPRSTFGDQGAYGRHMEALKERNWCISEISGAKAE